MPANIVKDYKLNFPRTRVYAAWVSSKTIIAPATDMDVNPVVGGHYRLIMETPKQSSSSDGTFLIVEENRHLRYTWKWSNEDEVTEIDVKFSSTEHGTAIHLEYSGFQSDASRDMHDSGWDSYIAGFTDHLNANKDR